MGRDIASTSWIAVLKPSASNVGVLFIDDMLDVLAKFLDLICHKNAGDTGAYGQDFELAVLRVLHLLELNVQQSFAIAYLKGSVWYSVAI